MVTMRDRPRSGQQNAGADHAVVRHHDQAVDLLVAGIGEREHRPVGGALARRLLHAAHDAVGAGRGRHQDAVGFGLDPIGDGGEVDRRHVGAHVHRLDGEHGGTSRNKRERTARAAPRGARSPTTSASASNAIHRSHEERVKSLELCRFRGWLARPIPQDL